MAIRWIVEWVYGSVYECAGSVFHTFFLFVYLFILQQFFGLYLTTPYLILSNVNDKVIREWSVGNDLKVTDRGLINVLYRNSAWRIE